MSVRFIYQAGDKQPDSELVVDRIVEYLSNLIDLPSDIEIVFAMLAEHEYGNTPINPRFKNRINVNFKLTSSEIPQVLLHELLHLSQIKSGRLSSTSNGHPIWNGNQHPVPKNADFQYYKNLPWELEVAHQHRKILPELLAHLTS